MCVCVCVSVCCACMCVLYQSPRGPGAAASPEQAPDRPPEGAGHLRGAVHRHGETHHEDWLGLRQVPG